MKKTFFVLGLVVLAYAAPAFAGDTAATETEFRKARELVIKKTAHTLKPITRAELGYGLGVGKKEGK